MSKIELVKRPKLIIIILLIGITFIQCKKTITSALEWIDVDQEELMLTDKDSMYNLSATIYKDMIFLEHIYLWKYQSATSTVIASKLHTGDILVSDDLGQHFYSVYESETERWSRCLTTESGRHLLWDMRSSKVWLFDPSWNLIKKINTGKFSWHGSWSIADYNNIIMYAEYESTEVDSFHVWRSKDDGDHWEKVFSQCGRANEKADIRHFHTVQPDPFNQHQWFLSSGDVGNECKVWKSSDDGTTWQNVTDTNPQGTNLVRVHRYTAIAFDEDFLYWGTDDELDGRAKFVRAKRAEPLQVEVINDLGNIVRNLIVTSYGFIFISERKIEINGSKLDFNIYISPDKYNVQELYRASGDDSIRTGFTYSKSSLASKDGIFFSYFDGSFIFPGQMGMLRWKISKK